MGELRAVDLFVGCGGLSLGLEYAGFSPSVAFELSPMAAQTYYRNFHLRGGDWDQAAWDDLLAQSPRKQAELGGVVVADLGGLESTPEGTEVIEFIRDEVRPDLVAGGPPCQGFSTAGRRDPSDHRNLLPWAFLDFVASVNPKGVVMENVVGMRRAFDGPEAESTFGQLRSALMGTGDGYYVQPVEVDARHFGVPQRRPRVMLLGLRAELARAMGLDPGREVAVWRSRDAVAPEDGGELGALAPLIPHVTHGEGSYQTAGDALADLGSAGYDWDVDDLRYGSGIGEYAWRMRRGHGTGPTDDVLNHRHRKHGRIVVERFKFHHFMRDNGIKPSTLGLPALGPSKKARHALERAFDGLEAPAGLGRRGEDLIDIAFRLSTRKHSQRAIALDQPAPTVVTLPDDYVHPTEPRVMTVRELARLQSFPDWFEFMGQETTGGQRRAKQVPQFSQVGNAVPPLLGEAVGRAMLVAIEGGSAAA